VNISYAYKRTRAYITLCVRVVVWMQQCARAAVSARVCVPLSARVCARRHVCGMRTALCACALNGWESALYGRVCSQYDKECVVYGTVGCV
jgi:hypothetical protein